VDTVPPNQRVKKLPFTDVGGEGARGENDPPKVLIYRKSGKNS